MARGLNQDMQLVGVPPEGGAVSNSTPRGRVRSGPCSAAHSFRGSGAIHGDPLTPGEGHGGAGDGGLGFGRSSITHWYWLVAHTTNAKPTLTLSPTALNRRAWRAPASCRVQPC